MFRCLLSYKLFLFFTSLTKVLFHLHQQLVLGQINLNEIQM